MAGNQAARQWFGSLMQPASDRETWLSNALPDYISLLYLEAAHGRGEFYSQMLFRRNVVLIEVEKDDDVPLGIGTRCPPLMRTAKGAWLLHMLRYLMYDLEKQSDVNFLKLIREFAQIGNSAPFINEDFIKLAEKYYGGSLDWFFHHWLYDRNVPEYRVEYEIDQASDGYYIAGEVSVEGVGSDFTMPVIMHVESVEGKSTFHRQSFSGLTGEFRLGPFSTQPKELHFNEFFSVLSKDNVNKR
jgi:hypothetical protein